jgi:signal transduction histidine kinase
MSLSEYTAPVKELRSSGRDRPSARRGRFRLGSARTRSCRLLIAFGVLLILAIVAGSGLTVWQQREKAFSDAERELSAVNVAISEQTARMVEGVDLVLTGVVEMLRQDGVSSPADYRRLESDETVHEKLRERIAALPHLDAVAMIDAAGDLINFSRYWPVPKASVTDRDYFIHLRDHPSAKSYVSAPVQNRGNGTWTIFLARRVDGPGGIFVGVVLGAIELDSFEKFYRSIGLGEGGGISLWRRDGVLLARHPRLDVPDETIGRPFPIKAVTDVLPRADAGTFRTVAPMDGIARVVSARAVRNYPLTVSVSRTEAAILSGWRSDAILTIAGGLIGAIAVALFVWALARRFAAEALAARAETASRTKSEFLATMSHELRTPLNAIIGFADVLRREMFGPLGSERYRDYAGDIADSGAHLLAIINDILEVAKADAGNLELVEEAVDVGELVSAAMRLVRPRADSGGLSLSAEIPPDAFLLRADARML